MIQNEINEEHPRFAQNSRDAFTDAEVIWVTFDTLVDEEDQADVEFVLDKVKSVLPELKDDAVVLISSQIPVGSVRKLEHFVKENYNKKQICFACSPEIIKGVIEKPEKITSYLEGSGQFIVNAYIFNYKPQKHHDGELYLTSMLNDFVQTHKMVCSHWHAGCYSLLSRRY